MKTRTEGILIILKVLAFLGAIGYSIVCGSQLLSFIASFINPAWAKLVYGVNQEVFNLQAHSMWSYVYAMLLVIMLSAMKAFTWYVAADLLLKLRLNTPFSMDVVKKLERIAYLLFGIWLIGLIGSIHIYWHHKTDIKLAGSVVVDEYLFIAGIVYVISQIFKRGIEIQEENQLTV